MSSLWTNLLIGWWVGYPLRTLRTIDLYWLLSQMIRISNSSLTCHWFYCLFCSSLSLPTPDLIRFFFPHPFFLMEKLLSHTCHLPNRTHFVSLLQWTDQSLYKSFSIICNILLEGVYLLWAILSLDFKTGFCICIYMFVKSSGKAIVPINKYLFYVILYLYLIGKGKDF